MTTEEMLERLNQRPILNCVCMNAEQGKAIAEKIRAADAFLQAFDECSSVWQDVDVKLTKYLFQKRDAYENAGGEG